MCRARKLGRMVEKGFWGKVERVVGVLQKVESEEGRRGDMDRHLVNLVRQTEKYGESLVKKAGESSCHCINQK